MFRSKLSPVAALGAAVLLAVFGLRPAGADTYVFPSTAPPPGTNVTGGTLVAASPLSPAPFSIPGFPFETGVLAQAVIEDAATGDLDYIFQWTNTSSGSSSTIPWQDTTNASYQGFVTSASNNAGFVLGSSFTGTLATQLTSAGFTLSGSSEVAPNSVTYTSGAFNWSFANPNPYFYSSNAGSLATTGVSDILVIATSAKSFDTFTLGASVQDSVSQNLPAYEPLPAPEPSVVIGLAGLVAMGGLSAVGFVARRKSRALPSTLPAGASLSSGESSSALGPPA